MSERHDPQSTADPISAYQDAHHQARYRWAVKTLQGADGPILDIACGNGYGSHMLARAGHAVTGLDVSAEAVEAARAAYAHPGLSFQAADAQDLAGFADASVAAVVSFETIEHLREPRRFISEVHRVLRPGGRLLVSTPNRLLASTLYPLRGRPNNPFHRFEYTLDGFRIDLATRFPDARLYGQGFVAAGLSFWPVQVGIKAACKAFSRFGAYHWADRIYHDPADVEVLPLAERRGRTASFFVADCRRA